MGYVLALEIGNETVKLALGGRDGDRTKVTDVQVRECKGFSKGEIDDRKQAEDTLAALVNEVVRDRRIDTLNFMVPSKYIKIKKIAVSKRNVSSKGNALWNDMKKECIKKIPRSEGMEVLDIFPVSMEVNGKKTVLLPRSGNIEEIRVVWEVYMSGSSVLDSWFSFLIPIVRASSVVFLPLERALGTAFDLFNNSIKRTVVDMGARAIRVMHFSNGILEMSKILPVGSSSIENDISVAFKTELPAARMMKERSGNALRMTSDGDQVEIPGTGNACSNYDLSQVIQCRMEELFEGVLFLLQGIPGMEHCNVILTGGGMKLANSKQLFDKMAGVETAPIVYRGLDVDEKYRKDPANAAVIGGLFAIPEDGNRKNKGLFSWF